MRTVLARRESTRPPETDGLCRAATGGPCRGKFIVCPADQHGGWERGQHLAQNAALARSAIGVVPRIASQFLGTGTPADGGRLVVGPAARGVSQVRFTTACHKAATGATIGTSPQVDLGYARVSTAKQDLDRQLRALGEVGIPAEQTFVDKSPDPPPTGPGCARCSATPATGT